tara:strand:+ start:119 stop:694 length:576 start_codon:yes stop_codon:yes gene_type:complete
MKYLNYFLFLLMLFSFSSYSKDNTKSLLTYDFIGIGFGTTQISQSDLSYEFNGMAIEGGKLINENYFSEINYSGATSTDSVIESTQYEILFGYIKPISKKTHFTGIIGVSPQKIGFSGEKNRDVFIPYGVGIKTKLSDRHEVGYRGYFIDSNFISKALFQYKIDVNYGLIGQYVNGADSESFIIGFRIFYD